MAHVIGSDAHSAGEFRPPNLSSGVAAARAVDPRVAGWMVLDAPLAILAGEPLPARPGATGPAAGPERRPRQTSAVRSVSRREPGKIDGPPRPRTDPHVHDAQQACLARRRRPVYALVARRPPAQQSLGRAPAAVPGARSDAHRGPRRRHAGLEAGAGPAARARAAQPVRAERVDANGNGSVKAVVGDACSLPAELRGERFDLVYSNSVLEHVGGHDRRLAFAASVHELGDAHWIQTPYRYFPVEPHWLCPGLQLLPVRARAEVTLRWPLGATAPCANSTRRSAGCWRPSWSRSRSCATTSRLRRSGASASWV